MVYYTDTGIMVHDTNIMVHVITLQDKNVDRAFVWLYSHGADIHQRPYKDGPGSMLSLFMLDVL